ncbi:helix-turn-helix transcriptional regulator [Sneathiella limimaris]|uniref:helix-turn-helix transcriptional regulator n=1 Tax=Sneathiella limimaris TaxID=1964213 RepID=UPI00146A2ED0|nr:YafY family protein [Sneathiella limimaris]
MRRADRLFQIIQILNRKATAQTAEEIALELEVSVRTVYRDIQDLMKNHVPIVGERGTGYLMQDGYHLPPLMFTEEEIDAVMLGVDWVRANGDPEMQRAAEDILAKIGAVLPKNRQALISSLRNVVYKDQTQEPISISMPMVRDAIRRRLKIDTTYHTLDGRVTNRVLSPLLIVFFQNIQLLVAWCDLRQDIRHFRLDRFKNLSLTNTVFTGQRYDQLKEHLKEQDRQKAKMKKKAQ